MKIVPAQIKYRNMRFVIIDRPSKASVGQYVKDLRKLNTSLVVRVCEPTYEDTVFEREGIAVSELMFEDGEQPPGPVIKEWLRLTKKMFSDKPESAVAVHCVAGLGRAPVLVAISLIEGGMRYEDAVESIRRERKGALNMKQLEFLEGYKGASKKGCSLM